MVEKAVRDDSVSNIYSFSSLPDPDSSLRTFER